MIHRVFLIGNLALVGCVVSACDGAPGERPHDAGMTTSGACGEDATFLRSAAAATATAGDVTYAVGYTQASSNNQNPWVARVEGDAVIWCRVHSTAPPDERATRVHVDDQGRLWVAFTADGGNTDLSASSDAFQRSYGSGGGPKVSFLARLDPESGDIERATFLRATLMNGNSNTLVVTGIDADSASVTVTAEAYYTPPLVPAGTCGGASPFAWTGTLNVELSELTSGVAPGCE